MPCGVVTTSLAATLVPALVIPIVTLNLLGLTIHKIHKRHKRQRGEEKVRVVPAPVGAGGGGGGGVASAGEAVITSTSASGEAASIVVAAGQSTQVPASATCSIVASSRAGTKTKLRKIRKSNTSDVFESDITGQHTVVNGEDSEFDYVVMWYEEPSV